jgi:hypothetical protein
VQGFIVLHCKSGPEYIFLKNIKNKIRLRIIEKLNENSVLEISVCVSFTVYELFGNMKISYPFKKFCGGDWVKIDHFKKFVWGI